MTFGSLFAGIGGMDLGLERAGMQCRWQVEINPYCRKVLAKHWPDVPRHDDVKTFNPEEWPVVDIICGGDPCQGNSNAGSVHKREREDLAIHFLRIVAAVRPRFVLRENPSVTRPGAAWPWQRFRAGLESLGYSVLPFRVRACCLGLDHQRERLFLLAELPNTNSQRPQRLDWSRVEAGHAGGEAGRLQRHHDISSPRFCRGTDGVPARVDRLVGAGNAVAPSVAEWIGRRLMESA